MDFSRLAFKLHSESKLVDGKEVVNQVAIRYGAFLSTVVDFLIVAFVIFLVVKAINRLKRQQEAPAAAPSTRECPHCISSVSVKATRCPHCTSLLKAA
jgi:large conductance mechanosensitive channel